MEAKQVIVIRKDLKMRRGKEISQGSHGSLGAVLNMMTKNESNGKIKYTLEFDKGSFLDKWLNGVFTKVVCVVNSEEELLRVHNKALVHDIPSILITDRGRTEFNNEPTNTCVCIGPHFTDKVDIITGDLKLY